MCFDFICEVASKAINKSWREWKSATCDTSDTSDTNDTSDTDLGMAPLWIVLWVFLALLVLGLLIGSGFLINK